MYIKTRNDTVVNLGPDSYVQFRNDLLTIRPVNLRFDDSSQERFDDVVEALSDGLAFYDATKDVGYWKPKPKGRPPKKEEPAA